MNCNDLNEWADLIDRFVNGHAIGTYEWDDSLHVKVDDPLISSVQGICGEVAFRYPDKKAYCSAQGVIVLLDLASSLRNGREATKQWVLAFLNEHGLSTESINMDDA